MLASRLSIELHVDQSPTTGIYHWAVYRGDLIAKGKSHQQHIAVQQAIRALTKETNA